MGKDNFGGKTFLYFAIGCMGVVGMFIAYIIACLVLGPANGPYYLTVEDIATIVFSGFAWSFFCGYIAYNAISKKFANDAKKSKAIRIKEGKSIFSFMYMVIATMMAISLIICIGAFSSGRNEMVEFSAGFVFALLLWLIGIQFGRKLIDKEEAEEKTKKTDKKPVKK